MDRPNTPRRCHWCGEHADFQAYHDTEWGFPVDDDQRLFEKLCLEGFQSGLSWLTILRKRENFRAAFDGFDPHVIARYRKPRIEKLMQDAGIVRNRSKIEGTVAGAKLWLDIMEKEDGGFSDFIWQFTDGRVIKNRAREMGDIPSETPESKAMSKELKARGFKFVGPTICYAFMQAVGMVNDHVVDCFRHEEV